MKPTGQNIALAINPKTSAEKEVLCPISADHVVEEPKTLLIQTAVQNNIGIIYFQHKFPIQLFFSQNSVLDKLSFTKIWNEYSSNLINLQLNLKGYSKDSLKNTLLANNVFIVSESQEQNLLILLLSVKLFNNYYLLSTAKLNTINLDCNFSTCCQKEGFPNFFHQFLIEKFPKTSFF
ncbi:ap-1 complex subunit beta-1 [Anaeramoeba ignava]|uniref:Ap-1 complex subunit beta-1 n=1 Tax=Anaeramoeba ignava TaxID=1746090 RepID=A0A9Q0LHF5_ANAIG|nr:ap-1 complex subunit beta-1 [Anaeramoeba ignava]